MISIRLSLYVYIYIYRYVYIYIYIYTYFIMSPGPRCTPPPRKLNYKMRYTYTIRHIRSAHIRAHDNRA